MTLSTGVTSTPQEGRLLQLLSEGYTSKSIAGVTGISEKTVRTYLWRTYKKLGVKNSRAAVAWYVVHYSGNDLEPALSPFFPKAPSLSTFPTADWYRLCLTKGYNEAAISHWQMTPVAERDPLARYSLVLILFLQSRFDEGAQETTELTGPALQAAELFQKWLMYGDEESMRNLHALVMTLPVGGLRHASLLGFCRGAMAFRLTKLAMDVIGLLYADAQMLHDDAQTIYAQPARSAVV
ncbi:MAG: helix-turn-helix transcriptional regulator [Betaproteobacteria bacterium]|nr:helix-turn-helix transcriptional regulator [Betaproteobacteria bacterium]